MKVKMIEAKTLKALVSKGYSIDDMVDELGISEATLWDYIQKYKITLKTNHSGRGLSPIEKLVVEVEDFIHEHDMDGARFALPPDDSEHELTIDDKKIELVNTQGYKMIYDRIRKTFVYFKMKGDSLEKEMHYLLETLKQANENFIKEAMAYEG